MRNNSNHLFPFLVLPCIVASTFVAFAAAYVSTAVDGRATRRPRQALYSIRNSVWKDVQLNPLYHQGWFQRNLRCSYLVFLKIYELIQQKWLEVNSPPGNSTVFFIKDRVAVTLYYLVNGGTFHAAGNIFGISKSRTISYFNQVLKVILRYQNIAIKTPGDINGWKNIMNGFEKISGFPNVCGAIGGSLIPVEVTGNKDGWYCRKRFTSFNMQAVVDHTRMFISFSIRSGCNNDKSLFNSSSFGQNIHKIIPQRSYFLGDAGYQLHEHILTPYKIHFDMSKDESNYNYIHSRTRIVVECAFGLWKSTFRIFES